MRRVMIFVGVLTGIWYLTSGICFGWHPGEVGGQALKLGADARAVGAGQAFCAVCDDVNAVYWNPAGLNQVEKTEVCLTHLNELVNVRYFNLASAHSFGKQGTLGCDVFCLYSPDPVRDEDGNKIEDGMDYNSYFTLAYARQVTSQFSSGISLKTLYNQLYTYKSSNVMVDWGGLYELSVKRQGLKIGVLLQNIPTTIKFTDEFESVPFNLKAGIAWLLLKKNLTLSMDVNIPIDARPDIYTGAEYWIKNILALRTGYKYQSAKNGLGGLENLACGLGFRIRRYQLDYAFLPRGALGNNTHMFSLGAKF